jgi:hypothetical protein
MLSSTAPGFSAAFTVTSPRDCTWKFSWTSLLNPASSVVLV